MWTWDALCWETAQRNFISFDKVQLQAISTVLGPMKSTLMSVLVSESGEEPLDLNRLELALRYVANVVYESPMIRYL